MSSDDFATVVGRVGSEGLSDAQIDKVKALVKSAHGVGIGVRFWDTPGWPVRWRNKVWRGLMECGVDLLNADDVWGAASMYW